MSMSQVLKTELTLKEKLLNMADTIRNNAGITQCSGRLAKDDDSLCVLGLLGFRAGIPRDDMKNHKISYEYILGKYGFSKEEIKKTYIDPDKNTRNLRMIYFYNDFDKMTFDQIADVIEEKANSL